MILDDIIALFFSFLGPLFAGVFYLFAGLVNLLLFPFELLIGVFIDGFKMKKIPTKGWIRKSDSNVEIIEEDEPPSKSSPWVYIICIVIVALVYGIIALKDKEIQFVATDGKSLPFAEIVITTNNEVKNKRTDLTGKIEVPRFGLVSLKINDTRYVEQTWSGNEIQKRIIVKRSIIGSGLDKVVDFIKKKKE